MVSKEEIAQILKLLKKDKKKKKVKQKQKQKQKQTQNVIVNIGDKKQTRRRTPTQQKPNGPPRPPGPSASPFMPFQFNFPPPPAPPGPSPPVFSSPSPTGPSPTGPSSIQSISQQRNITTPPIIPAPSLTSQYIQTELSLPVTRLPPIAVATNIVPEIFGVTPLNFPQNTLSNPVAEPLFEPNKSNDTIYSNELEQNIFNDQSGNIPFGKNTDDFKEPEDAFIGEEPIMQSTADIIEKSLPPSEQPTNEPIQKIIPPIEEMTAPTRKKRSANKPITEQTTEYLRFRMKSLDADRALNADRFEKNLEKVDKFEQLGDIKNVKIYQDISDTYNKKINKNNEDIKKIKDELVRRGEY